jgi:hypothetical protein
MPKQNHPFWNAADPPNLFKIIPHTVPVAYHTQTKEVQKIFELVFARAFAKTMPPGQTLSLCDFNAIRVKRFS